MADSDINLETILEQLEFNYGGVLQELARLHDTIVEQMEVLKTAGVKIRRKSTTYATGTVLVCVGKNNGNKRLKCKSGGTTSDVTWTESTYNGLVIGNTYSDGSVVWEVMEEAFTSGSIVESAMEASHASTADFATSAASAGYALNAAYIGPFRVVNLGTATSSGSETPGGPVVTSTGINYEVIDTTRNWASARAGNIVNGESTIPVPYNSGFLPDGRTLYLQGSSSDGQTGSFNFGYIPPQEISENQFLTALAHNSGGKVQQIQFGDIVTPWPGEEPEEYQGPFKVEPTGEPDQSNNLHIRIYDPTAPLSGNPAVPEWAGKIFAGEQYHQAPYRTGNLNNNDYIYLIGDSSSGVVTLDYKAFIPNNLTSAGFYVRLAKNEGGKIVQIQHGDITVPPWKVESANHAATADSATEAEHAAIADYVEYQGPFHVKNIDSQIVPSNPPTTNFVVRVDDDTRGIDDAGAVIYGSSTIVVPWSNDSSAIIANGVKLFLVGTSNASGTAFSFSSGTTPNPTSGQFWTQLAYNSGGKLLQVQFGDIVEPWPVSAPSSVSTYDGPFFVQAMDVPTFQNTVNVRIVDLTDWRTSPDTPIAGRVFDGSSVREVPYVSSLDVPNGAYVYLVGTSASDGNVNISATLTEGTNNISSFSLRLAKNSSGKIEQIQYGDIFSIPWRALVANSSFKANIANLASRAVITDYYGPFHVSRSPLSPVSATTWTVKIYDDTRIGNHGGKVIIGNTINEMGSSSVDIQNGDRAVLIGTHVSGGTCTLQCSAFASGATIPITSNQFYAQLAVRVGSDMHQLQYGDIIQPVLGATSSGGQDFEYNGPFKVSITGTTEGISTVNVDITDPTDSSIPQKAGRVFDGATLYTLDSSSLTEITDGAFIYLNGTSGSTPSISDTAGNNNTSQFSIRLAQNSGGKILQMHFGDVYSVPWNATNAGNGGVKKINAGPGVQVDPATGTGEVAISCTITGGTSVLPIDWDNPAPFLITTGDVYWTGDSTQTPQGCIPIGNGEGGLLVGNIQGPLSIDSYGDGYNDDDAYSYRFEIEINPTYGFSKIIPLLHPKKTEVEVGNSSGYCYTPRNACVWIQIPPKTEFQLLENFVQGTQVSGATHSLMFYPYYIPIQELEEEP